MHTQIRAVAAAPDNLSLLLRTTAVNQHISAPAPQQEVKHRQRRWRQRWHSSSSLKSSNSRHGNVQTFHSAPAFFPFLHLGDDLKLCLQCLSCPVRCTCSLCPPSSSQTHCWRREGPLSISALKKLQPLMLSFEIKSTLLPHHFCSQTENQMLSPRLIPY